MKLNISLEFETLPDAVTHLDSPRLVREQDHKGHGVFSRVWRWYWASRCLSLEWWRS